MMIITINDTRRLAYLDILLLNVYNYI